MSPFSRVEARCFSGDPTTSLSDIICLFKIQGAGLRVTNGYLSLSNVSVNYNTGLSTGAGIYMESNDELHVHIERANVQHNIMSGRGGGILAEMVEDTAKFVMSIHDSNISRNVVSSTWLTNCGIYMFVKPAQCCKAVRGRKHMSTACARVASDRSVFGYFC